MKQSVVPQRRSRRKFDLNFKKQAVDLWQQSGKSAKIVAAELGIHPMRLSAWKTALATEATARPKASPAQLEEENAALRREVEYLRQQRDILKKTLGILSEAPGSATNGSRP